MEISLSNDQLMVFIWLYVWAPVVAVWAFVFYRRWKAKRRAENQVGKSDLILLDDIEALAKSNSPLLADAIALYCAQEEPGRSPDDQALSS